MRLCFLVIAGSVLFLSGCVDRPEVPKSEYGIILTSLPKLPEAQEPFPFPIEINVDGERKVVIGGSVRALPGGYTEVLFADGSVQVFPRGSVNDHQNCEFPDDDF